jgi:hypothetical protein
MTTHTDAEARHLSYLIELVQNEKTWDELAKLNIRNVTGPSGVVDLSQQVLELMMMLRDYRHELLCWIRGYQEGLAKGQLTEPA